MQVHTHENPIADAYGADSYRADAYSPDEYSDEGPERLFSITVVAVRDVYAQRKVVRFLANVFKDRTYEEISLAFQQLPMLLATELSAAAVEILRSRLDALGARVVIELSEDVEELELFTSPFDEARSFEGRCRSYSPPDHDREQNTEEYIQRSPISLVGWMAPPELEGPPSVQSETSYVYGRTGKRDRVR